MSDGGVVEGEFVLLNSEYFRVERVSRGVLELKGVEGSSAFLLPPSTPLPTFPESWSTWVAGKGVVELKDRMGGVESAVLAENIHESDDVEAVEDGGGGEGFEGGGGEEVRGDVGVSVDRWWVKGVLKKEGSEKEGGVVKRIHWGDVRCREYVRHLAGSGGVPQKGSWPLGLDDMLIERHPKTNEPLSLIPLFPAEVGREVLQREVRREEKGGVEVEEEVVEGGSKREGGAEGEKEKKKKKRKKKKKKAKREEKEEEVVVKSVGEAKEMAIRLRQQGVLVGERVLGSVEEFARKVEKEMEEREKQLSKKERRQCTRETRQFSHLRGVRNPLFDIVDEKERREIFRNHVRDLREWMVEMIRGGGGGGGGGGGAVKKRPSHPPLTSASPLLGAMGGVLASVEELSLGEKKGERSASVGGVGEEVVGGGGEGKLMEGLESVVPMLLEMTEAMDVNHVHSKEEGGLSAVGAASEVLHAAASGDDTHLGDDTALGKLAEKEATELLQLRLARTAGGCQCCVPTAVGFKKLKSAELHAELRKRGLSEEGTRKELFARLEAATANETLCQAKEHEEGGGEGGGGEESSPSSSPSPPPSPPSSSPSSSPFSPTSLCVCSCVVHGIPCHPELCACCKGGGKCGNPFGVEGVEGEKVDEGRRKVLGEEWDRNKVKLMVRQLRARGDSVEGEWDDEVGDGESIHSNPSTATSALSPRLTPSLTPSLDPAILEAAAGPDDFLLDNIDPETAAKLLPPGASKSKKKRILKMARKQKIEMDRAKQKDKGGAAEGE